MSEWQPIETGPTDGSYVLVSNSQGAWVAHYVAKYQNGYVPNHKWHSVMLNHRHMPQQPALTPTHWMPLPEPPEA